MSGGGQLVVGFVPPALGVDGFRSWVVSEHYAMNVIEKVCAVVRAGVRGVKPFVALWGDQGW